MKAIAFNNEMVQAILDDRKTQTRRVIKKWVPVERNGIKPQFGYTRFTPKNHISCKGMYSVGEGDDDFALGEGFYKLPYQINDILYVQETWFYEGYAYHEDEGAALYRYVYKASNPEHPVNCGSGTGWESPKSMPKEAARVFLQVTGVRVERLQDISLNDIRKEGFDVFGKIGDYPEIENTRGMYLNSDVKKFKSVWNTTIKHKDHVLYGWDANPWVWVINFERCEKPEEV